jgi:hypothetical protein
MSKPGGKCAFSNKAEAFALRLIPAYLLLAGGGKELVAAGGAPITSARANASIAIFHVKARGLT